MQNGLAAQQDFRQENSSADPFLHRLLRGLARRGMAVPETIHGVGAFALIALGVALTKSGQAAHVVHPIIRAQIHRAGIQLLPMACFLALALGFVIVGQTVSLLSRVGATDYTGLIMVTVVVREIGPLATALMVLARVGTALVIELSTARALGEVEALEALGIDPIHYLVVPRMIGLALSIFSLTIYLILMALFTGYLFAILQDVPLPPMEYLHQIASALLWQDFVLLTLKSCAFGIFIAVITCYHGLARPLRIEDISHATTRAVVQSIVVCLVLDAAFILIYLML